MTPLNEYLAETHKYYKENRMLYRLFNRNLKNVAMDIASKITGADVPTNALIELVFNYGYALVYGMENDELPMIKIEDYFRETANMLSATKYLKHDYFNSYLLSAYCLSTAYVLRDLPYSPKDVEENSYPDELFMIFDFKYSWGGSGTERFGPVFSKFRELISDNRWQECKDEWIAERQKAAIAPDEYGQKIVVEMMRAFFKKYGVTFTTKADEAHFLSIITRWNTQKIAGLLSNPGSNVPTRNAWKVDRLNELLKQFGVDVEVPKE